MVSPFLEPVWRTREVQRVGARESRVVSRDGLAIMKRAAARPKDLEDLRQLGMEGEYIFGSESPLNRNDSRLGTIQ